MCAVTANAQLANTTALVGNVIDPTGKSVQGAKVIALETGTGDTRTVTTNDQGYYSFEFYGGREIRRLAAGRAAEICCLDLDRKA